MSIRKINRALISVYHKDERLKEVLALLHKGGVELLSTGGTHSFITAEGYPCVQVESLTDYPAVFGGRVKTLHPAIFGGILNRRDNEADREEKAKYNIGDIDLVIVDLYPFEATVASGASEQDIIEKIDIGGISLIRAAAKNFADVLIVSSERQYSDLIKVLAADDCKTDLATRKRYACEAFAESSRYDSAIFNWFASQQTEKPSDSLRVAIDGRMDLRYGENPHQKAAYFGAFNKLFDKLNGKEISYNNLLDIDSAVKLISDFKEPTFAILKHNNACGVATRPGVFEAWKDALACDPVSAFGGVLVTNVAVDTPTAEEINKLFFEVIIAPDYTEDGLAILKQKKNRIILLQKEPFKTDVTYRSALNGVLEQELDSKVEVEEDCKIATDRKPTEGQMSDLLFANKIVKHSKSNAIVLAKDGQLMASGVGQTSRIDALRQAVEKANAFGFDLKGAVMASDAFFPFSDCVETAYEAGIEAVIHPGGSIRDQESIDFCQEHNMVMAITGFRHFRH